jgi:hypothetical protein
MADDGETVEFGSGPATSWSGGAHERDVSLPRVIGRAVPGSLTPARVILEIDRELRIAVADEEGGCLLSLGPFPEEDVIAIWRALGATSGLALSIRVSGGAIESPCPQLGRVRVGAVSQRRRLAVLSGRRPRFLARRKPGRPAGRPLVYPRFELAAGTGA